MTAIRAIAGWLLVAVCAGPAFSAEARLVRYPHYHQGKVAFTYMGDIWTADESGANPQRLTAHRGRDTTPRFSPDGKWIAFSSDRAGNMDVWVVPLEGGTPTQLTFHSSDDNVLGWTPDGLQVLFATSRGDDFLGTLYTVPMLGGAETKAGTDYGLYGSYSPDGTKLAFNRKGQSYWRKGYRGSYQTDVTVLDTKSRAFTDVTNFLGMDTWPMWGTDGYIYFVSDRDEGAQSNVWRVPEAGGEATRVTTFTDGDVRFPSISADGKTIVFERDFRLWKLDVETQKPSAIPLIINTEPQDTLTNYRTINSEVDDYDVAPNGRTVVAAVRGELLLVPVSENGELAQLTKGWQRDYNVEYSPDGKWIAFVSDKESGREEVYVVAADGSGEPKRITDLDALKTAYTWSPDSKTIAVCTSDGKLWKVAADGSEQKELLTSKFGTVGRPMWSPDGSLLTFSMADVTRTDDVYLLPAEGGEAKKVTFDSVADQSPAFSADGKKVYFIRSGLSTGDEQSRASLMVVYLERQEKDPDEANSEANQEPMDSEAMRQRLAERRASEGAGAKKPNIDWGGLKRRTQNVLRSSSGGGRGGRGGSSSGLSVVSFTPARDGRTILFATASSGSSGAAIYSCTDDGKNLRQIVSTAASSASSEEEGSRGGGRSAGNLRVTRDGRSVFYQLGDYVYSASVGGGGGFGSGSRGGPPAGATSSAGSAPAGAGGGGRRVNFTVTLAIDRSSEWKQMFGDAWRTMNYRFYDPQLHGVDWRAARAKYEPIVAHVADRQELMNLINEMIGELNASHTGAAASSQPEPGPRALTVHLGLDLAADSESGRYKVTHIFEEGPADKDWVKVSVGDYLLAIDGEPIKASDSLWKPLSAHRLNKKIKLTLNTKPEEEGAWDVRYEPISWATYTTLRYERWVKDRRKKVDELSGGRLGYVHIKAMDQPSLRRFEKELRENRHKEALVIDQRFNGGGNIEQELLAILVQKPYQVWQPRGTEPTNRPLRGYFGPKIVLQNWRSASNAEMFPAGFRALGLGKLVGTPTMGAVIGTGSYSLIDGSTIRTPHVGVFLGDASRTNMENYGVQPDIAVENTPEDNLAGRDRQLETAVTELMSQLQSTKGAVQVAGGEAEEGS